MHLRDTRALTLEGARAVLAAAVARIDELGHRASVAVVDAGGHVIVLERMDGAASHTVHSATTKAAAAASMRKPTGIAAGGPIDLPYGLGIALAAGEGRWTPLPGGVPLVVDGECVGAVGVAGAPPEVDELASAAATAALDPR
jgi:uncharacterized protein GlcG (DUF336 family)